MCQEMDRLKKDAATATEQHEQIGNSAQTESHPDHSDNDSNTKHTSNETISSLPYDESNDLRADLSQQQSREGTKQGDAQAPPLF